jgi:FAD/FMN-containing dehydrogenase
MSATLNSALVAKLGGEVSGSVLGPQDAGYDPARAVHNGLIDRRPALIVRCRATNDVAAALALARRARLEVSIRGGGHNVAGGAGSRSCGGPGQPGLRLSLHPFTHVKEVETFVATSRLRTAAAGPQPTIVRTGPCLP